MNQQLIDTNEAKEDLLACSAFLAENIKSSDGYAEAMKEIIPRFLAKDSVDLAAELADSIEDPFVRDQMLTYVAVKCAELDDDEYAMQLAEALEDKSFQGVALEGIGIQKAVRGQIERAFEIAGEIEHPSNVYAVIAAHQDPSVAMQTIDKIEYPHIKVSALQEIFIKTENLEFLDSAGSIAAEIDLEEERIRAYLSISFQYIEAKRKDKAIETLDKAKQFAETLNNAHREPFLSQISQGFMKAGSLDLADRTLDLVTDKFEIAQALVAYSAEFDVQGEKDEAIDALTEGYAILKSQRDTETRNSQSKFNLFGTIAINFASLENPEKGIEIALENPYESVRYSSLTQIAQHCILQGKDDLGKQAIDSIKDDSEKTFALIAVSDAYRKQENTEGAADLLGQAYANINEVQQFSMRSMALNQLARRFQLIGDSEKARELCTESLDIIPKILDESDRAAALAGLSDVFAEYNFQPNDRDKKILLELIRKCEM